MSGHGLDQGDAATGYHSELVPFVYGAEDPVDGYTGNGDALAALPQVTSARSVIPAPHLSSPIRRRAC